jgi:hypothetical protein
MSKNKINFSKLGFDQYQSIDLRIMMSLNNDTDIRDWMATVGTDDVCYGLSLMECAALAVLDQDVAAMDSYPDAMLVIQSLRG